MNDGLVILHTYSEMTSLGFLLIILGILGLVFALTVGIFNFLNTPNKNQIAVISILIVLVVAAIIVGCKLPRKTLFKAYAQDGATLRAINEKYEIVDVEGMLLTLQEKEAQDD